MVAHAWFKLSGSRPRGVTGETPLGNEPGEESSCSLTTLGMLMESSESDRVSINMDHLTITLAGASIKLISNKTHTFYIKTYHAA